MSKITIKNSLLTVLIDTFGAELKSIKSNKGTEFLWQGDENSWAGQAPILFPICGQLKDDKCIYEGKEYSIPKHGFARSMEFEGDNISESKANFTLKSSPETLLHYPFEFIFTITYELLENTLIITYSVKNLSGKEMLFSVGSHEGFSCPEGIEEYYLEFDEPQTLYSHDVSDSIMTNEKTLFLENAKTLPLKYEYFKTDSPVFKDTKFKKVYLVHEKSKKKITFSFPGFDNFLIWSIPGANFLCLEPWAGYPDNLNSSGILAEKDSIIKLEDNANFIISRSISFEE